MGNGIDIKRYKAENKFLEDNLIGKDIGLLHKTENGFELYYNFRFRVQNKMRRYATYEEPTRDVISILFDLISYNKGYKKEELRTKYDVFAWHTTFIESIMVNVEGGEEDSSQLKVKVNDWYEVLEGVSSDKVNSLMAEYIEKIRTVGVPTKGLK